MEFSDKIDRSVRREKKLHFNILRRCKLSKSGIPIVSKCSNFECQRYKTEKYKYENYW
jgi:hypothetical protein